MSGADKLSPVVAALVAEQVQRENTARAALLKRLNVDKTLMPPGLAEYLPDWVLEYFLIGVHLAQEQPEFKPARRGKGAPKKDIIQKSSVQLAILVDLAADYAREDGNEPPSDERIAQMLRDVFVAEGLNGPRQFTAGSSPEAVRNAISLGRKELRQHRDELVDLFGLEVGEAYFRNIVDSYLK